MTTKYVPLLCVAALLISACAGDLGEPVTDGSDPVPHGSDHDYDDGHDHGLGDWEEDPVGEFGVQKAVRCDTRYTPSDTAAAAAETQNVPYDSVGSTCSGGATAGARVFGDWVRDNFGDTMNLSVPGRGVQIYNCRAVRGGTNRSVHGEGRAVDIFFNTPGGAADNANGDQLANWLIANAEYIGVQMIIWDRTIWTAERNPQSRCYRGSHPHNDHIHVELTREAASQQTAFFAEIAGGSPVTPDVNVGPAPWIGTVCESDADCNFVEGGRSGRCFPDAFTGGVCTVGCEGYCPDRGGYAPTFCATLSDVGGLGTGGTCLSRSDSRNNACESVETAFETLAWRFVGNTGASRIQRTVCAPRPLDEPHGEEPVAEDPPQPPPEPDPVPPETDETSTALATCGDDLEINEHNDSCAGWPAEHWRCACNLRLGTTVSQVCRAGRWLNYQTDPADCGSCNGAYDAGCEQAQAGNGGVCSDPSLPLSDHNRSCSGFPENYWRCACSEGYEQAVSQVCRGGRWINYETNPRNCATCEGGYSSGCEQR